MVYISGGSVCNDPPWSIRRLVAFFWGIIAFIVFFFKSLVGLDGNSGNGSGSSGRGGGRGGPGGPGGGPRRIGRITTIDDCSMPGGG